MDPAQRAQLLATKLRVLVTEHAAGARPEGVVRPGEHRSEAEERSPSVTAGWEVRADTLVPVAFFAGAAALVAKVLFVLVEPSTAERAPMDTDPTAQPRPPRGWLGGVVVLAQRHGCTEVNLLGDMLTGDDARRASRSMIPIRVWSIAGRVLTSVDPVDHVAPDAASAEALAFESTIVAAGADPVIEHGVLRAEVRGLEVARTQIDPYDGITRLEVGVGRHDRLAQAMMNQGQDPALSLRHAVESVLVHRRSGASSHPANQIAVSRWLRYVVAAHPEWVGCTALTLLQSAEAPQLKRLSAALLLGDSDAGPTVVACSVGVDLDAAIDAVDAGVFLGASRVVLCLPETFNLPAVRIVAGALILAVEVVVVAADWADRTG